MKKSELVELIHETVMDLMSNRPKSELHDTTEAITYTKDFAPGKGFALDAKRLIDTMESHFEMGDFKKLKSKFVKELTDDLVEAYMRGRGASPPPGNYDENKSFDKLDIPESIQNRTERFVMSVPNDANGQAKIKALKMLFGKDYRIQLRGRHSDRKAVLGTKYTPGTQNDIPPDKAEWIAVYADPKNPNMGRLPVTPIDDKTDDSEMDPAFKDPANSRNLSYPHPAR